MTSRPRNEQPLVEQQHALEVYFESLLTEYADDHEHGGELGSGDMVIDPQQGDSRENMERVPATDASHADAAQSAEAPGAVDNVAQGPAWALPRFEAVVFEVDGLRLAVASREVAGVTELPREIDPPHIDHPWVLGSMDCAGSMIDVLDTAEIMIPPEHRVSSSLARRQAMRQVIWLTGGQWGLACGADVKTVTLEAQNIQWRTARTRRQWLAGTALEYSCGVLDVTGLVKLVRQTLA